MLTSDLSDPAARAAGLGDLVRRSAARFGARTAIIAGARTWTYEELVAEAEAAAAGLAALGVRAGDRVAVFGRNSDRYAITWLATQLMGAVHVPLNFMLGPREVGYILGHSGASVALADDDLHKTLVAGAAELDLQILVHEAFHESLDRGANFTAPAIDPAAIAQIAYTSGTESAPKGAMLSHAALTAQYVSCIVAGRYSAADVMVHALPLYHCAQMHCFLMPMLALGARNVIIPAPTPAALIEAVATHGATSIFAPPTVWIGLLHAEGFTREAVPTLAKGYYGASIMPVQTVRSLLDRFPGLELWNYYGQTELGPLATCLPPEEQLSRPGSAGLPVLNVETRVVDDDMADVGVGEVGEVVHRSPQLTSGYYEDPERTAAAYAGGWFHSGDLATIDADGYITIVDRKKDMINTGGENVSSREVEEILYEHPGVAEVAVVGLPDDRWIEAVCAIVVRAEGAAPEPDELQAFARTKLAGFKVPKRIEFVDALPKNPSGKILKRELRGTFSAAAASQA